MASRKRQSDTAILNTQHSMMTTTSSEHSSSLTKLSGGKIGAESTMADMKSNSKIVPKTRLRVRMKRFHGVAKWTWNAGSEDEVCGICQSAFEGVAPGVKFPGDECPVVFGKCGHAFHLQCVSTWLNSSRNTCPICRREWEFGQSSDQVQRRGGGGGTRTADATNGMNNVTTAPGTNRSTSNTDL